MKNAKCNAGPLVTLIHLFNMSDQTNAVFVSIETSDHIVCTVNTLFLFSLHLTLHFWQSFFGYIHIFPPLPLKNDNNTCFIQLGFTLSFILTTNE